MTVHKILYVVKQIVLAPGKLFIQFLFWMTDTIFDIQIAIYDFFGVEHGPHPRDQMKALRELWFPPKAQEDKE